MDGTPLDRAYTFAKAADAAVLAGDFAKAAEQFMAATEQFEQVSRDNPDTPSARTLQALAEQHRGLAEYFGSGRAAEDVKKHANSPVASTYNSISSDSGPPTPSSSRTPPIYHASKIGPTKPTSKVPSASLPPATEFDEAVTALATRSAAVFARQFDQVVAERLGVAPAPTPAAPVPPSPLDLNSGPSESFYLVKPKAPKPSFAKQSLAALAQARNPEIKAGSPSAGRKPSSSGSGSSSGGSSSGGLCNTDRAEAIERASNAQREVLKAGLQQLVGLVTQKEERLRDVQLGDVDQLRAENDRLKIQVSKLKSRWEDLKESARKRQLAE